MHLIKCRWYIGHPVKECRDARGFTESRDEATDSLTCFSPVSGQATFTYLAWQCDKNTFRIYNLKRLISNVDEHSWRARDAASRQIIKTTKKSCTLKTENFTAVGGKKPSCCALQLHFITCEMKKLIATMMTGVAHRQPGLSSWVGVEPSAGET